MRSIDRRTLLRAAVATATAAAAGGTLAACTREEEQEAVAFVKPDGEEARAAEARRNPGVMREFRLEAVAGQVDLGGLVVPTWTYGGAVPGTPIRIRAGEVVRATLTNRLPNHTTIHWHGVALRNDADGVPDVTQPPVAAGEAYVYEFTAAHPGTFWFHPHAGVQLDRGLYAPLIVEDPNEPLTYDDEWIVVLGDWLDGVDGRTPDAQFAELREGMEHEGMDDMGGMMGAGSSDLLGGDAGDVTYPHYVLNGRVPGAPDVYRGTPGARLRIRIVNAAGDTAFRVALGGHRMTMTNTDGLPVEPIDVDALLVGMGERRRPGDPGRRRLPACRARRGQGCHRSRAGAHRGRVRSSHDGAAERAEREDRRLR